MIPWIWWLTGTCQGHKISQGGARGYMYRYIIAFHVSGGDGQWAKVTKCCSSDLILKIYIYSCTGYIVYEQNQRKSYTWENDDNNTDAVNSNDDPVISMSNNSFIL